MDWSDAEAIGKLRVGDFACGTGALLSAVYEQIAARHERTGRRRTQSLHSAMMEEVLLRLRCDALGHSHHRLHAGRYAAERWQVREFYVSITLAYGRQE